jgi:hypothetical protein
VALIEVSDLTPFAPDIDEAKAQAMIEDALALAAKAAPCILEDDFAYAGAAKAILRGAILRWNDAGSGALSAQSVTVGPFANSTSFDTRTRRRSLFFPSEITDLQALCSDGSGRGAYTITLAGEGEGTEGPIWWP